MDTHETQTTATLLTDASHAPSDDAEDISAVKPVSPLLRSAKVVCFSGQYICLVRDASEDGVLLSYLHDAPPDPRLILALGNGLTYPIQRIWSGQEQAGYRFAARVDLDEFLHERTPFAVRPVRLTIAASTRVVDGTQAHAAQLVDISTHGAMFEITASGGAPMREGRLISFQIHGMGQQLGEIIWREKGIDTARYGIQFQQPLTLRELAQAALRMQPFGPTAPKSFSQPLRNASAA